MLNFDENHDKLEGEISKRRPSAHVGKTTIIGLLFSALLLFSGCVQSVNCNIEGNHAHTYRNEAGFEKYVASEKVYDGYMYTFERTDEHIYIDENEEKIINFENKNDLLRIENNKDKIQSIVDEHEDFKEYRYKYTWEQSILNSYDIGDQTYYDTTYVEHTDYSWTSDPNKEGLTGEERIISHAYYGYKIIEDKKGKLKIEESGPYKSIEALIADGYTHIKEDFYKNVLANDITKEPDYESKTGPETTSKQLENNSRSR